MKITDKLAILAELLFVLYIFSFDQKKKKITDNLKTREVIGLIKKEKKREVIGWMIEVKKKKKNISRLVYVFKQQFSVFKQHFTYFKALFHPYVFPQMFLNNNFQFLNTHTKRALKLSSEVRTTISLVPQTSTYYHVTFLHLKKKKKNRNNKLCDWVYIFKKIVQRLWAPLQVPTPTALFPKTSVSLSLHSQKAKSRPSYKLY